MNHIPIKLTPETDIERMARFREEADEEDRRIENDLFSGKRDAERARSSKQALAMIASLPPAVQPDPVEERRKADAAVAGLARGLLESLGIEPPQVLKERRR